jgi:hypothetical protein
LSVTGHLLLFDFVTYSPQPSDRPNCENANNPMSVTPTITPM